MFNGRECNVVVTDYLPKVKRVLLQEAKKCLKTESLNFKFIWATNGNVFARRMKEVNYLQLPQ